MATPWDRLSTARCNRCDFCATACSRRRVSLSLTSVISVNRITRPPSQVGRSLTCSQRPLYSRYSRCSSACPRVSSLNRPLAVISRLTSARRMPAMMRTRVLAQKALKRLLHSTIRWF
ncbi:hypothetical protein D3C80_1883040 [compost metagenome]